MAICQGLESSNFTGTLGYGKLKTFIRGDPHFTGFEGEEFDFHGKPDTFYCLISDDYLQVNTYFRGWNGTDDTGMGQIGLKIGTNQSGYTYIEMDKSGEAKVNGNVLKNRCFFPVGIGNYQGEVLWSTKFKGFDPNIPRIEHAGTFENAALYIDACRYQFAIVRCSEPVYANTDHDPYFLNLISEIIDKKVRPHGIIGQTADFDGKPRKPQENGKQGEGIIEGKPVNYEVSSLFSSNFKFSRFGKSKSRIF